jgi:hypothetical protein
MEPLRKPRQSVWNIVLFNWHCFALPAGIMLLLALAWRLAPDSLGDVAGLGLLLAAAATLLPLIVSVMVYDTSKLHTLDWLDGWQISPEATLVNIHSGFDETSGALHRKFPAAPSTVLDFYDHARHAEISIRHGRAR